MDGLRNSGVRVDTIVVGGRSGTEHNAREIAAHLAAWPVRPDVPLILIGYSKGAVDILQFLVDFPEAARQVDAVVSVAGSVGGSPLADEFGGLYAYLFSHLPSDHCPPGDGDVVHSLRTDVRDACFDRERAVLLGTIRGRPRYLVAADDVLRGCIPDPPSEGGPGPLLWLPATGRTASAMP